jgi:hypothetical protein
VPYSDEYRDRVSNDPLLRQLAATVPKGGIRGLLVESPNQYNERAPGGIEPLLAFNTFRHDLPQATSRQDVWHWLVLAACGLYFVDIFLRRVAVHFEWVTPLAKRLYNAARGRNPLPAPPQYIERLRSRKAEVVDQWDELRASTRFVGPLASQQSPTTNSEPITDIESLHLSPPPAAGEPKVEEESYTERLLRAKKKAWEEREG